MTGGAGGILCGLVLAGAGGYIGGKGGEWGGKLMGEETYKILQ